MMHIGRCFRVPLSGITTETSARVAERSSYYPQEANSMPRSRRQRTQDCLRHNILTMLTIAGVVGGIILGLILRSSRSDKWPAREIMYVNYLGELFLRMLKSLILPLIMASLISAIGSLDLSLSGKIGARAITYYMTTTISAVILGELYSMKILLLQRRMIVRIIKKHETSNFYCKCHLKVTHTVIVTTYRTDLIFVNKFIDFASYNNYSFTRKRAIICMFDDIFISLHVLTRLYFHCLKKKRKRVREIFTDTKAFFFYLIYLTAIYFQCIEGKFIGHLKKSR